MVNGLAGKVENWFDSRQDAVFNGEEEERAQRKNLHRGRFAIRNELRHPYGDIYR